MKKTIVVLILAVLLSGCATYKFQHGEKPYEKGYVVSRNGYPILEYTAGRNNSVPEDLLTAKMRFRRRYRLVEYYYKKMGEIENRFKETVVDPPLMALKFLGGILRVPFVAVSDYRYEHNPRYREEIKKREQEQDEREAARIARFREYLSNYIQKDLTLEQPAGAGAEVVKEEAPAPAATALPQPPIQPPEPPVQAPVKAAPAQPLSQPLTSALESPQELSGEMERQQKMAEVMEQAVPAPKKKELPAITLQPKAIIIAKPVKGYAPLKVKFNGSASRGSSAKITSYLWDFGDGDTSTKPKAVNTYYSGSYDPKHFTVTLTVTDSRGNSDTAHVLIEVLNK